MVKRRKQPDSSSEDSASDFEPPTSRKSAAPRRKRPITVPKHSTAIHEAGFETYSNSHSQSRHIIPSPNDMRLSLLDWYSGVHDARGMPWRKPYDPTLGADAQAQRAYEVWISEIMLQQTQVNTVIPYYNRWMSSFPTIKDLAASDIETVNSLWKGLGYYSRAARLLAGAKKVVQELDDRLPNNAKDMESKIPGVGRYTAGAICSIAYNEQVPVLDGNVSRLMSRLLAIHAPPKSKASLDLLWQGAQTMVEGASCAGDVNQALIELGSTVCKPRDPDCGNCPLQKWCRAYQVSGGKAAVDDIEDLCTLCDPIPICDGCDAPPATSYPMKTERKKQREELNIVSVVEWRNGDERSFLLTRRPEGGLLAGLHEFPTSPEVPTSISPSEEKQTAVSLLSDLIQAPLLDAQSDVGDTATPNGYKVVKVVRAGDVLHVFSHIRKTYRVQWVVLEGGSESPPTLTRRPIKAVLKKPGAKKSKTDDSIDSTRCESAWHQLGEVEKANIGTGVMKVWALARSLWEKKGQR